MRIQSSPASVQRWAPGVARIVAAAGIALGTLVGVGLALSLWQGGIPADGMVLVFQAAVLLAAAAWLAARTRPGRQGVVGEPAVPSSAMVDLVAWHDSHGDVIRASSAAPDVIGAAPSALQGSGLLNRIHVADRPAFLKAISDAANGLGAVTVGCRIHAGSTQEVGHPTFLFAEVRAVRLPGRAIGDDEAVITFIRDVSARHNHERELDAARLDAEKANELKGRFLATVSHELRTPLNAIIGFSELLAADHPFVVTEERRKEYAQIIRTSGLHLLEIVNTLLDMSKIETGNFQFDPESFDFGDLAGSVCDLMQLKADQAGVMVERRLDASLPEILADRRACRQILINLLSNAVKFTPRGGRVTVALSARPDALVLSIADTGIGIPETDLPRLGDPFFQSGDVHRRNQEGTGLGLSVVRGIVGLHHGQIAVESGAGAGTTVTVTLPLRPDLVHGRPQSVVVQTRPRVAVRPIERKIA